MSPRAILRSTIARISRVAFAFEARLPSELTRRRSRGFISRSGLFDEAYYKAAAGLPDRVGMDEAIDHYLMLGASAGLSPHPAFDVAGYRAQVGRRVRNPLLHYLKVGSRLGLSPGGGFDPAAYRRANPDVSVDRYESFAHALRFEALERRAPSRAIAPPPTPAPGAPRRFDAEPAVDVIVPVYKGLDDALRTLHSALSARTGVPHEIVVIDDATPEPEVAAALDELAAQGRVTLLRNAVNRGFVASVNRGMALHPSRDIVLLNADTAVFDHWLDRLHAPFASGRVGTATPLSNAATIFSYPIRLRDNPDGLEIAHEALDRMAAGLDAAPFDAPTGVGFCMAISRACLREVGMFDEANFGRGYGEENDFCVRAAARNWRNVAVPNLYVWHRGGGAFGAEREERAAAAMATLARLHPDYSKSVAACIRQDPFRPAREALDVARLIAAPGPRTLVAPGSNVEVDGLAIDLIADIGPFHGFWRLAPRDFGAVPNLPRISASTGRAQLARLFDRLAIDRLIAPEDSTLPPRLAENLRAAWKSRQRP